MQVTLYICISVYLCVHAYGMGIFRIHTSIHSLAIYMDVKREVTGQLGAITGVHRENFRTMGTQHHEPMPLAKSIRTCFMPKAAYGRTWQNQSHSTRRAWFGSCFPTSTVFFEWRWYRTQKFCASLGALVKFAFENLTCVFSCCFFKWTHSISSGPKSCKKSRKINQIGIHHAALQPLKVLSFTCSLYSWHVWIPGLTSYTWCQMLRGYQRLHSSHMRMMFADIGDGAAIYVAGTMLSF